VNLADLTVTRHPFLPDQSCPVCATGVGNPAGAVRFTLPPRPAHRPGSYRVRAVADELDELTARYVDERVGVVRSLDMGRAGALVVARAPFGWRAGGEGAGYGWTDSSRASRLTALLEALERYASEPPPARPAVTAAYTELGGQALDPRILGVHSPDQYRQPGFNFQPFAVDRPYRWVWGWSFARQEPILVPERYAYYRASQRRDDGPAFAYEISNGCALGGCLEEAILYGILEVAERDAFLLTWYTRLPAPPVDLTTAEDASVLLLAGAIRARTGFQVRVFDTSVEQGIPCVWAMAVNLAEDGRPAVACAAGSHLDPEQAVGKALRELGPSVDALIGRYARPAEAARARAMAADSSLVTTMDDHAMLYADHDAAARLRFLGWSPGGRKIADIGAPGTGGPGQPALHGDDLRDCLLATVARYTRDGMDVIVVDQTTAEHRAGGLSCVKVVIPGTLPMTFGHANRRTHGIPRLGEVPRRLGYRDRPLEPDQVNPYPHPFP
jgi:ribosomal protein S12 methylthiotransferase accessory factor